MRENSGRLLFIVIFFLFAGCINLKQPGIRISYYSLDYSPPAFKGLKKIPTVIRVNEFMSAPDYSSAKIIYGKSPFQKNAYVYHRWRSLPSDLVTGFLIRDLRNAPLFEGILEGVSSISPPYMIEGRVDEFYEKDEEDGWKAVLSLSITLTAEKPGETSPFVIFQRQYKTERVCPGKHPEALAEAMSSAMESLSTDIIKDVYKEISSWMKQRL